MKVYALVGKSGTGKSFQAPHLCRKLNIETIIDDGVFIYGNEILAGTSAKKQTTKVGAIKTALFTYDDRRAQVRAKIEEVNPKSILVLGTSDKMVSQICDRLGIGQPEKTIYIEEITSEEERQTARVDRDELGRHAIPAATMSIKQDFSGYLMDTLKNLVGRGAKAELEEKTVVRPTYSYLGDFVIGEKVIESLVEYSARDIPNVRSVAKVDVKNHPTGIVISLQAVMEYGASIPITGRRLQQQIASRVALMTAFNIDAVNIEVKLAR